MTLIIIIAASGAGFLIILSIVIMIVCLYKKGKLCKKKNKGKHIGESHQSDSKRLNEEEDRSQDNQS
jgi:hypothetical protein